MEVFESVMLQDIVCSEVNLIGDLRGLWVFLIDELVVAYSEDVLDKR